MADFDLSSLLGQQPVPGLLSPEQQGNAGASGLMSLGAGLIKAGGPSPYKNNFSGVGDAIQGGLDAYHKSTTQALQNQYIKGQINKQTFDQTMQALQMVAQYKGADLPIPPELQAVLTKAGFPPAQATPPAAAGPAPLEAGPRSPTMPPLVQGGPAPAGPPPMPPAGLLSPQGGPGPVVASAGGGSILPFAPGTPPPQIMGGGAPPPAPAAAPPPSGPPPGLLSPPGSFNARAAMAGLPPQSPPGPPSGPPAGLLSPAAAPAVQPAPMPPPPQGGPASVASLVKSLPVQDRYALIGGGPVGKIVEGVTQKNLEQTNEGKNARDPAVIPAAAALERAKADATADAKTGDTIYKGVTGQASIAAQQKQNIGVLRQIASSPGFTPGAGSDLALSAQRLAAQLGINPQGAAPRELFNQISARILADQFSGLKSMASETGEAGGRIFKPMLDLEEKANITSKDSLAGINAKLNLLDKSGDLMMKWGNMADDYKLAHGHLDENFYKQLRQSIGDARIDNVLPKPAYNTAADVHAAVKAGTLKSGDHFTDGKGDDRMVP